MPASWARPSRSAQQTGEAADALRGEAQRRLLDAERAGEQVEDGVVAADGDQGGLGPGGASSLRCTTAASRRRGAGAGSATNAPTRAGPPR